MLSTESLNTLNRILEFKEIVSPNISHQLESLWKLVEMIKVDGGVFIVKADGERTNENNSGDYTIMVSGNPLQGGMIREDTDNLIGGMFKVILAYSKQVWGFKD